jgi:hypothetical protein
VPLNAAEVAEERQMPEMVTIVPTGPLVGEKVLITGATQGTLNDGPLAVPHDVVRVTTPGPGAVATTDVSDCPVNSAGAPPKATTDVRTRRGRSRPNADR